MKKQKVFGIGFHKTGTSTLDVALQELGYKVLGARTDLAATLLNGDIEEALEQCDEYDALQDNPWPLLYKELDDRYPNSKFILTVRDENKWIKSVTNHFGKDHSELRRWIYGIGHPLGNEEVYLNRYKDHNQDVLQYFSHRKDDLLVIEWDQGKGWEEICDFLNEPIPDQVFPHANKGNYSKNKLSTFAKWLKQKLAKYRPEK